MRRRDFLTGSAALAAYAQVREAEALVGSRRALLGNAGIPSWAAPGSLFGLDFANSRYWPAPLASQTTFSRASVGEADNVSGVWSQFLSGVARINNKGLRYEPGRTNSIRNPKTTGAVAGTSGGTGALPTNWVGSLLAPTTGGNYALASVNGIDFFQESVSGSPSATAVVQLFDAINAIAVTPGQVVTASLFTQLLSGSLTSGFSGFDMAVREYDNTQTFLRQTMFSLQASSALVQRFSGSVTMGASTAFVANGIRANYAGGATAFNLGVGWPGLETGSPATSPMIPTGTGTSSATSRLADVLSLIRTDIGRIVFIFSDGTTQTISGITKGTGYTVPTTLNEQVIARMDGYAS